MDVFGRSAAPPPTFGIAFLDWFRAITERNWAARQEAFFEGVPFGSQPWQQNAHWLDGLPDATIDELERTWDVRFPPDYRLFLQRLHAPDRAPGAAREQGRRNMQWPFFQCVDFYNWQLDVDGLRECFAWPLEGLLFDVERSNLWRPAGGRSISARRIAKRV